MNVKDKDMDLSVLRPWTVRKGSVGWDVVAPAKYDVTKHQLVACALSYPDACLIATAPRMQSLLEDVEGLKPEPGARIKTVLFLASGEG